MPDKVREKECRLAQPETAVRVNVQPKASRNQVLGFRENVLQVKVTAPPERGKANEDLVELLAESLGVSKGRIRILKGHTSREKWIGFDAVSLENLHRRLGCEWPR